MSRRIAQSSVNWAAIAERVPPNQKVSFSAFKSKSDKYLRRWVKNWLSNNLDHPIHNSTHLSSRCMLLYFSVMANPENPPKIDWAAYQKSVPIAGMVDNFQKQYEALKIPFPVDTLTAQVEAQKSQVQKEIESFVSASKDRITTHEKALAHIASLLPFDQMTMEDYRDAFPDLALDPINRPTFWPHNAEEQLENQPKEEAHHH